VVRISAAICCLGVSRTVMQSGAKITPKSRSWRHEAGVSPARSMARYMRAWWHIEYACFERQHEVALRRCSAERVACRQTDPFGGASRV
jgi:hypothetical protein